MPSLWSSEYAGWHSRAKPTTFTPSIEEFVFTLRRNEMVEHDGFSVAFFKPHFAIDANGEMMELDEKDWEGIMGLLKKTLELPQTMSYRNTWRVKHPDTCYPNDRLKVKDAGETTVYGFDKWTDVLDKPVHEYDRLPPVLFELMGLLLEGREGYKKPPRHVDVVNQVKSLANKLP